jgi:hypothetical protein
VTLVCQELGQMLFQLKPGVIGGDGDSHSNETVHHPALPGPAV